MQNSLTPKVLVDLGKKRLNGMHENVNGTGNLGIEFI